MSNQPDSAGPLGKIVTGSDGLGTVTPEMVEERARELARMDGRDEPNAGDRNRAQDEFLGPERDTTGPEAADENVENITAWDESPEEHGSRAPQVLPEDEANMAETLVQEGLEEADHDRRKSAVEEFPPTEGA